MGRLRRIGRGLLVASACTAGVLLLAEAGVRLFVAPPVLYGDMIEDAALGFRQQPDLDKVNSDVRGEFPYRTNHLGFRGPELPRGAPSDPATREVLVLGDSFLNAWSTREEEWIGTVLQEELAGLGVAARVHALCADDYGTAQELLLLREYGPGVRPDFVVLLLFPGNDLANNTLELAGKTLSPGDYFRPYLVPDGDELRLTYSLPLRALLRRSRLFSLAESQWLREAHASVATLLGLELPEKAARIAAGDLPEEYLEVFRREDEMRPAWQEAWRTTEALLLALRREVEGLGARLLVATIPHLFQVERGAPVYKIDAEMRLAGAKPLDERVDWNLPERRLEAFFHRAGIEHVELLTPLREELAQSGESVFGIDGHLAGPGHRVAGRLIADALARPGARPERCDVGSAPVDLAALDPERDWIDFTDRPRPEFLAWGFEHWYPDASGGRGAWRMQQIGTLLVPARMNGVAVRGFLPPQLAPPVRVTLTIGLFEFMQTQTIEHPGDFELRFAPSVSPEQLADRRVLWGSAVLKTDRTDGGTGLFVTGFGAADAERPPLPNSPHD